MFNPKNLKYSLSIVVALLMSLGSSTLPTQAQVNSPSGGPAGTPSGTPPAINNTVLSVPPTNVTPMSINRMIDIRIPMEILTTNTNTGETNIYSREIRTVQELSQFVGQTVGEVLTIGTGEIRIAGLTVTIADE